VLDQTYPHLRVCVYDNASDDGTAEVVNALASQDSRVRYYRHPANIGLQDNLIFGLCRVDTPLFNLLSDDDFLLPTFLAEATSALEDNPTSGFFFGAILSADPKGRVIGCSDFGSEAGQTCPPPRLFQLLAPNTRTWTSILFKQTLAEGLGGLNRETGYGADTDFILRSAARYPAVLSNTPCAVFTLHPGSMSVSRFPETFESSLSLALFDSVNLAIDGALKHGIVNEYGANEMKASLRQVTERGLVRGAFGVLARGRLSVAARASGVLAEAFKRQNIAAVINAAARDNSEGSILRLVDRSIRATRSLYFAGKRHQRYAAESQLVKKRLLQLE
jgi:glycosyltransferase involved in cell wall biosynthesis